MEEQWNGGTVKRWNSRTVSSLRRQGSMLFKSLTCTWFFSFSVYYQGHAQGMSLQKDFDRISIISIF